VQKLANRLMDKYVSPAGYMEWNKMLRGMTAVCSCLLDKTDNVLQAGPLDVDKLNAEERSEAAMVMTFLSHTSTDPAAFYVKKELIDAFCMTKVPAMGGAPNRVLDSFVLMVPHNTFQVQNGYISHIHVVDRAVLYPDDGLTAGVEYLVCAVTSLGYGIVKVAHWDDTGNDRLNTLVKNVILAYNYQPEMFSETPAQTVGGRGSGFGKKPALTRSPLATRWLGADYVIKKERPEPAYAGSSGRVGNPKRPHWRQGHWHTVCFGPGHKQRKQQWFQPVYVNAA
jgi:hypothetical protein